MGDMSSPNAPAVVEERNGEIEFRVVNNDGERESVIILSGLKCVFQKQLPEMSKTYIARLVYDRAHVSIIIVRRRLEVVGGITYRPFEDRGFAEIAFCAVLSDEQIKGYGTHLMSHLKDYIKASSNMMHLLTYADDLAIGYFKKQGFTKDIMLDESVWKGCIKDYQGGTLMQCSLLPRIRYLELGRMLLKQKACVQAKIQALSKSDVVHQPPKAWENGVIPIDPLSIDAIRASGWSPEVDELMRQSRHRPSYRQLSRLLSDLQKHKSSWPFLEPVSKDDVADYYETIKEPMDLSTMEARLERYMWEQILIASCLAQGRRENVTAQDGRFTFHWLQVVLYLLSPFQTQQLGTGFYGNRANCLNPQMGTSLMGIATTTEAPT
ncbi:GCN5-related N-acetyltransferase [Fusarium vanettenii 77-13-4]